MARVVRMHGFGGADVLRVDEVEVGPPSAGEVRIKVGAIGLNRVETVYRAGQFLRPALPARIGYEAAGTIDAVGSRVTGFAPGDRVATLPGLAMDRYGTYADTILCPADMLVGTPAGQDDVEAAATWMQYLTAYAIRAYRPLSPGDPVVITAASSSVGLAAIQLANWDGAVSIATTRGTAKAEVLRRHGTAHVVTTDGADAVTEIRNATGGTGAALVFDAEAGIGFGTLLQALRPGGMAIVYGMLAGDELALSAGLISGFDLTVKGYAANYLVADNAKRAEAVAHIGEGLASGRLTPVIDRTFPLADIAEAHRHLESNSQIGKIVVTVD